MNIMCNAHSLLLWGSPVEEVTVCFTCHLSVCLSFCYQLYVKADWTFVKILLTVHKEELVKFNKSSAEIFWSTRSTLRDGHFSINWLHLSLQKVMWSLWEFSQRCVFVRRSRHQIHTPYSESGPDLFAEVCTLRLLLFHIVLYFTALCVL